MAGTGLLDLRGCDVRHSRRYSPIRKDVGARRANLFASFDVRVASETSAGQRNQCDYRLGTGVDGSIAISVARRHNTQARCSDTTNAV
jgi:hypothetical protein